MGDSTHVFSSPNMVTGHSVLLGSFLGYICTGRNNVPFGRDFDEYEGIEVGLGKGIHQVQSYKYLQWGSENFIISDGVIARV
ncbi:hypothetical protein L6452_16929 [Arctium lappa]|uniref:Uncharacterized protein n=1 Tax=Arctium lappa TaxID=4217 RepID=A0ACB9C261_ARCLA|nr:hypothetical protein L6452_16929 [Arctium lappa]